MSFILNKFLNSFIGAFIFAIISFPITYKLTSLIFKTTIDDCPTSSGHLLHTIIFMILVLLQLIVTKWRRKTLMTSARAMTRNTITYMLIYFFLSSPDMYKLTSKIWTKIADKNGCPSNYGIILHAFVYMLFSFGLAFF